MLAVVPMTVCGRPKRHSTTPASATPAARGGTMLRRVSGGRLTTTGTLPPRCGSIGATMLAAYRRTGADPPFGDPRGYHGVGMEGYYWRVTQPSTGEVVVAIVAISRDAAGERWAM